MPETPQGLSETPLDDALDDFVEDIEMNSDVNVISEAAENRFRAILQSADATLAEYRRLRDSGSPLVITPNDVVRPVERPEVTQEMLDAAQDEEIGRIEAGERDYRIV